MKQARTKERVRLPRRAEIDALNDAISQMLLALDQAGRAIGGALETETLQPHAKVMLKTAQEFVDGALLLWENPE